MAETGVGSLQDVQPILDDLCVAVLLAEGVTPELLAHVKTELGRIEATAGAKANNAMKVTLNALRQAITRNEIGEDGIGVIQVGLQELSQAFASALDPGLEEEVGIGGEDFELPPWVDEALYADFISSQRMALEEIEASFVEMEQGSGEVEDHVDELKRRLHTLKGESGTVGLGELAQVYHAIESLLLEAEDPTTIVGPALSALDWLTAALKAYSEMRRPAAPIEPVLALLAGGNAPAAAAEEEGEAAFEAALMGVVDEVAYEEEHDEGTPVEWDEETAELVGEFLTEATEGIETADRILLEADGNEPSADDVNALFRGFHTIKGVAGFLGVDCVLSLAHSTETLLNKAREGEVRMVGGVLDLVFEATNAMRELLDGVRIAAETSGNMPTDRKFHGLIDRLSVAPDGVAPAVRWTPGQQKPSAPLPPPSAAAAPAKAAEPAKTAAPAKVAAPAVAPVAAKAAAPAKPASVKAEPVKAGPAKPAPAKAAPVKPAVPANADDLLPMDSDDDDADLDPTATRKPAPRAAAKSKAAAAPADANRSVKLKEVVKVDLERVDGLVDLIGELVILESMVANALRLERLKSSGVLAHMSQLNKIVRDLQSLGLALRMVPLRGVFQKMARLVRDVSHKAGKSARLVVGGEKTEMDRRLVESISDPLVHMVRNSVDHGLESPAERVRIGKPEVGTIRLNAFHDGGNIVIEISDDGKGLNREAILAKAEQKGLVQLGATPPDEEVWQLIFAPGFSTAAQVTEISGRGVGMDVVKKNIESMRGRITIESVQGEGTTFKLHLPLTLAIISGLLIGVGQERYLLPTLSVVESFKPSPDMISTYGDGTEIVNARGEILPLVRMHRILGLPSSVMDADECLLVIVQGTRSRAALLVDDVLGQQNIVIKTLGSESGSSDMFSGAAILSDGRVGLILNVDEVISVKGEVVLSDLMSLDMGPAQKVGPQTQGKFLS